MSVCEICARNLDDHGVGSGGAVHLDAVSLACCDAAKDVAIHMGAVSVTGLHLLYAMAELSASAGILEGWGLSALAVSQDAAHALAQASATTGTHVDCAGIRMSDEVHWLLTCAIGLASRNGETTATLTHLAQAFTHLPENAACAVVMNTHIALAHSGRQSNASMTTAYNHVNHAVYASHVSDCCDTHAYSSPATDISRTAEDHHTTTRSVSREIETFLNQQQQHTAHINTRLDEQTRTLNSLARIIANLRGTVANNTRGVEHGGLTSEAFRNLADRIDVIAALLANSKITRADTRDNGTTPAVKTSTNTNYSQRHAASESSVQTPSHQSASGHTSSRASGTQQTLARQTSTQRTSFHRTSSKASASARSSKRKTAKLSTRQLWARRKRNRSALRVFAKRVRQRGQARSHNRAFSRLGQQHRQRLLKRYYHAAAARRNRMASTPTMTGTHGSGYGRVDGHGRGQGIGMGSGTPRKSDDSGAGNGVGYGAGAGSGAGRGHGAGRGSGSGMSGRRHEWDPRESRSSRADRAPRENRERLSCNQRDHRTRDLRDGGEYRDAGPKEKRFYLNLDDDVVDAPSIGPKTAARLYKVRLNTVRDLLTCDPEDIAPQIDTRHITVDVLADWQDQARLVCVVPWLRGTHAQILVGAGFRDVAAINAADSNDIMAEILKFSATSKGQSVLRSGAPPEMEKVLAWVEAAGQAELQRAA